MPPRRAAFDPEVEVVVGHGGLQLSVTAKLSQAEKALEALARIVVQVGSRVPEIMPGPDTIPGGHIDVATEDDGARRAAARPVRAIGFTG